MSEPFYCKGNENPSRESNEIVKRKYIFCSRSRGGMGEINRSPASCRLTSRSKKPLDLTHTTP